MGGGIASLLEDETELRASASETGASVQNIEQLVAGDYDIAFSLADTAADAVAGTGSFEEKQPVEALGRIHTNYTQVVARKDANIDSVEDFAGKTVSTGSPKSGTEVIANRLIEAAGAEDVSAQRLDIGKSVEGLKDGSIDALVWSGGLPTPALTDLYTSDADSVEFVDITPLLPKMQEINPVYEEGSIPADTYKTDGDVATIVVPNVLLVTEDFPENNACAVTKAIWENTDTLAKVHPAANEITTDDGPKTDPIPLAPGAETALKELTGE
jgi:TRAP transporter TAXI family solute receptor